VGKKKMPKFSVIIPVYSEDKTTDHHFRGKTVQRAIKSIINQQFPDWELILVDDGCSDGITPSILQKFADSDERIKYVHQENQNRAIARNTGMDNTTGEWLCWLDSDDEYSSHYLRELDKATIDFPEYKIFNFGSIIHFADHHTVVRPVYRPEIEGEGHEWFRSGHIGAGSFIFRRDLWLENVSYRIPDEVNPYQFAAASGFDMRFSADEPYVENPEGAFSDKVYRHGLSLGNPWGDDFLQFFYLTRKNHSCPLDVLLYIQYVRSTEQVYDHFGEIYDC
jgi:glycosyltransferase involved in cell wall biosynthesis